MKCLCLLALLGVVSAGVVRTALDEANQWADYKRVYGREYGSFGEAAAFQCFRQNLRRIDELNANPKDQATYGVNLFSDKCPDDMKIYHNLNLNKLNRTGDHSIPAVIPAVGGSAINWVTKGAVTAVKNQGQCGSCWSFGCTGSIEGGYFLAGNTLTGFSEQELVSCDHIAAFGCRGAENLYQSYEWIVKNGGLDTEADYPYVSGHGQVPPCDETKVARKIVKLSGYTNLPSNEDSMASFCYKNGPIQVGVDAQSWPQYTGGIKTDCTGRQLDHSVLVVGFDDNNNPPYWIVKNSWTANWGENGYIRLGKGTNQCGIDSVPSFPHVEK